MLLCAAAGAQTPIADWHVNEAAWTGAANEVVDSSASAFHGTARNGATAVDFSGRFTNAAGCSATTNPPCQHVDFGNRNLNLSGGNVVTVMAWVRWSGSPQQGSPWANMLTNQSSTQMDVGQFWLQHSGNSTGTRNQFFEWAVQTQTGGGGGGRVYVFSQTRPVGGTWYHVAGVYDGSAGNRVIRIYVNGTLEGTAPLRNNIATSSSSFRLQMGQWPYNQGGSVGNRAFNGDIDEGRIFRAALTQAQIQAQMRIFGSRRPRAVDDAVSVSSDSSDNVVNVLANDSSEPPPGTTVAVLNAGPATAGSVTLVDGVVRYTPAAGFAGADSFPYTMIDSLGATASAVVYVDVVDNTPPDTFIVSGPPALDRSSTAGFDFGATEPAVFECSLDGSAFASCADPATFAPLADGPHSLAVRAVDGAGNVDPTPALWAWSVDATPPSIVSSSYALANHPFSEAAFITYVTGGMTLTMGVAASESLAAATFRFTSGSATVDFTPTVNGASANLVAVLISTPAPGGYAARAVLTDLAGNVADVPISLPAPGFVAADPVPSPCIISDTAGVPRCSDFDGDGVPGVSSACPGGFGDCDDTNPTVQEYATEIPGDGVDNACDGGGDAPVDEATGVFVAPWGAAGGAGTRAAPVRNIRDAMVLAASTSRVVFVAEGVYDDGGAPLDISAPLFGSFDASWRRAPLAISSTLVLTQPATVTAVIVVGMELDISASELQLAAPDGWVELVDARVIGSSSDRVVNPDVLRLVRSSVDGPHLEVTGILITVHSRISAFTMTGAIASFTRSTLTGPGTISGTVAAARSFIAAPWTSTDAVFRVSGSTFRSGGAPAAIDATGGVVMMANNIFEGSANGIVHDAQTIVAMKHNLFDVGCAVSNAGTCSSTTCGSNGNICAPALFAGPGDFHLSPSSPAIGAGMGTDSETVQTTTVVDVDGQCISGAPDIGADELP